MSGAAAGTMEFLTAWKTVVDAQMATSIAAVISGGGSALAVAPVVSEIRDDLDDLKQLPHLAIWAEESEIAHKISPFDDIEIPLRMAITCRAPGSSAVTAFALPTWYCAVLRDVFDELLPNGVAGAYWAQITALRQEAVEGDKWRRRAVLEGLVRYRVARNT